MSGEPNLRISGDIGRPRGDVAVVIPAYNAAGFVAYALASALAQRDVVREVVVVDDGSTDDTVGIVRAYARAGVKLIQQPNLGPSAARNAGWRAASAAWIQFLDADDFLPPGSLASLLARAASAPDGNSIPYGFEEVHGPVPGAMAAFHGYMARRNGMLLKECCVWYQGTLFSALIPRTALEAVAGFADDLWCGEDYDLATRLALRYPFTFVDAPTYAARMHGSNRHRHFKLAALDDYLRSIDRNLASSLDARARRLAGAARARWCYAFGQKTMEAGDPVGARRCFRRAIAAQPWKLGAWRGWLRSLLSQRR